MKRLKFLTLFLLLLAGLSIAPVSGHAQPSGCPVIVQSALTLTEQICSPTGRNQICYGNINIVPQPRPGFENLVFNAPGDIADVTSIQNMTLAELNEVTNEWGVALMRLQANLPGTLPGQNVSILAFGDVEFQDVTSQAFIFRSGIGDAPCEGAPQSGILVQTPEGAGLVNMTVNGVNVALGSTAFMQAEASQQMNINLISGQGLVGANGQVTSLPGGNSISIPMTSNLQPGGPASPVQPLNLNTLQGLPLNTLNTLDMSTSSNTNPNQPPPPPPPPAQPCTVRANRGGVALHVGPGNNRGVLGTMPSNTDIPAIGQNTANDGSLWYRLEKSVAAPGSAANEVWVAAANVTTMGGCEQVGNAAAPPIVIRQPPPPPDPPPGPGPAQTPDPIVGGDPMIEFFATRSYVDYDDPCTTIVWRTENIQTVFFDGRGVVGDSEQEVCPMMTTRYHLEVNLPDGSQVNRFLTIEYRPYIG